MKINCISLLSKNQRADEKRKVIKAAFQLFYLGACAIVVAYCVLFTLAKHGFNGGL